MLASVIVEGDERRDRAARIRELLDETTQRAMEIKTLIETEDTSSRSVGKRWALAP